MASIENKHNTNLKIMILLTYLIMITVIFYIVLLKIYVNSILHLKIIVHGKFVNFIFKQEALYISKIGAASKFCFL